jgi:hypothetical protein
MTGIIFRPGPPGGHEPPGGGNGGSGDHDDCDSFEKCCREILARLDKLIALKQN